MREEEGKTRRGKDGKEKNRKEKEKDDQVVPIIRTSRCAQPDAFSQKKNKNKKRTKAPHTPKKHTKRLFDFGFFLLVGLVFLYWVGGFWAQNPYG